MKTRKVFYLALFAFTYLSAFGLQPVKKGSSVKCVDEEFCF